MISNLYYKEFDGEIFVIQAEAEAVENEKTARTILDGIRVLLAHGIRVALVFGKSDPFEDELAERFGAHHHPETNRLVIPENALSRMQQERQRIAQMLTGQCDAAEIPYTELPESSVRAERRIGHESTGIVAGLDLHAIQEVLNANRLAIIGYGGRDDRQAFLHVPSVSLAADLAVELRAHKLLLLTHVDGIYVPGHKGGRRQISFADFEELLCLLQRRDSEGHPILSDAIVPKIHASLRAVAGNVSQVHIVSYSRLLDEVLTRTGVGTMIERQLTHHVDYAKPSDLDEIQRLHEESLRYVTALGTPYIKPLDREQLLRALPETLVLKHRDVLIGKLYASEIPDSPQVLLIGGFIIGENHQDSQQGQVLVAETLARFREQGRKRAAAITASDRAKRLFQRNGGVPADTEPWQQAMLEQARKRYHPDERDQVQLLEFLL